MRLRAEPGLFEVEAQLSFLFSALFGMELEAIHGIKERFCPDTEWFFFKNDNSEFAISSPELVGPKGPGGYHLALARMVRNLSLEFGTVFSTTPRAIPEFSTVCPIYCQNVTLLTRANGLTTFPGRFAQNYVGSLDLPRKNLDLGIMSQLSPARLLLGLVYGRNEHEFIIQVAQAVFAAELKAEGEKLILLVGERKMDEKKLSAQIALAELEMSLDQFLRIRPGTVIEFDHPGILTGIITVAGAKFAGVEVKIDGSQAQIKVNELLRLNS